MSYLHVLFICAILITTVSPRCSALPIKDDASKTGQDNIQYIHNQDKTGQRMEKVNITDNNKVGNAILTSANKSYNSSINDKKINLTNISGGMESSQNTHISAEPAKNKETKHPDFTYHVKVVNNSNSYNSIPDETQIGTKTDFDKLHFKDEIHESTNKAMRKIDSVDNISSTDTANVIEKADIADIGAKKIIVLAEQPESIDAVSYSSESNPNIDESENITAQEDKNDSTQKKNRNVVGRYRVKSAMDFEEPTSRILVTVMKRSSRFWEPWELNRDVCPPSLCTSSEENRPRGTGDSHILSNVSIKPTRTPRKHHPGGSVFFNGDIVLDRESEEFIYGPHSLRIRWKRAATRGTRRLWKDGIVPFTFSDVLPKSLRIIRKAMAHIEEHTCIRFRRKKLRDEDYIRFISEPGCWSNVGRVGGEQKVSIGRGCERLGTAIHEISHALGFWHEQARPDRDKYVEIVEKNISPRYLPDFKPVNKTLVGSRGYPYDYESVMHYSKKAFTNLGEDTIKVIGIGKKLKMQIGQRDVLSNLDIAQLRDMYNCNDKEDNNVTLCPSGWKKKGRSCYKFVTDLKYQFAAAAKHCEELNSHLLYIEDATEDKFIKRRVKKKYPNIEVWRTGGRKFGKEFGWFRGEGKDPIKMDFTKWKKGHPAGFSSMALVHNTTADRVRWEGVWSGSASQYPAHAYPFICERRARRKCLKGDYPDGRDYRGKLDHTIDGITCQKWSSQYPHSHKLLPYPYEDTGKDDPDGLGDHNYCRNPAKNRKRRPWCFTDKKNIEWQYCDVSICSKSSAKKPPVKEISTNKNTRHDSSKLTSLDKNNKKDYSRNEITTGVKGSNIRNNEIQKDQGTRRESNQKGTKKNNRKNHESNLNRDTNKNKSGSTSNRDTSRNNKRGESSPTRNQGGSNRNRQTGDRNTQNRHRNRRKSSQDYSIRDSNTQVSANRYDKNRRH